MEKRNGRFAIVEQLLADGIRYMFGNPGTSEEGFLDSLGDYYPEFEYILALQETIAVAAADGYARSTKKPTVVQLHSGVGLGNGIGMMYQAMRGHAPLVVLAGESGVQYDAMDAQMAADLVSMAKPVTKWATRVVHPSSLLRVLRRAIKIAATPPMGPVFVSLPMDVLDAPNEEEVVPTSIPITRVAPEPAAIAKAASMLAAASKPLIIVGDGIAYSDAQAELTRVAELTGAQVWGSDSSEPNMSATHPLFGGLLGHMFGEVSSRITSQADVVLICGTYVFPEVFPALSGAFAPGAKIVHIDLNAYEIAKNFPVDLGIVSDPKMTLAKLGAELEKIMTAEQKRLVGQRIAQIAETKKQHMTEQFEADKALHDLVPLHLSQFAEELARHLPPNAIVFDEAITHSEELCRYIPPTTLGHYFQTRGGSLGVGIPGAIGIKLAHPDKTAIGFSGDGGAMYTIQALWTAAHHNIDAKFVICNNRSYRILKLNILQYWQEQQIPRHEFPASFDLCHPDLRFDELARAMGVQAVRVETPEQIKPAIAQALFHNGPFLIDLVISNEVPGAIG
ncbi:thiamine pyrophosphate-binding protein [Chroococcidiopsis sp. FACHB-1243]|uniref:thiamine pyrophosphate-binding protein n=1 Tax=Chroococcidiopsis sp. [FACHB-1243] TaxID=2692781 RepID=UPI0017867476|nr:thiamine pyrophosphate-binding protein [Chroococcidiopsis sp. [FACHB-1243]]MBD2305270.1 thiamine pyrophosphate-binding protein [Chroococcidiopsis sp. [FACHB-1243]]